MPADLADVGQPAPLIPWLPIAWAGMIGAVVVGDNVSALSDASIFVAGLFVAGFWLAAAVWIGREVARAGNNGWIAGGLFVALWPVGLYLWWRWRLPGPLLTKGGRRLMIGVAVLWAVEFGVVTILIVRAVVG